jgi:hypothetical protein
MGRGGLARGSVEHPSGRHDRRTWTYRDRNEGRCEMGGVYIGGGALLVILIIVLIIVLL